MQFLDASGKSGGFFAQHGNGLALRGAAGFPFDGLGVQFAEVSADLGLAAAEFANTLGIKNNFIFGTIRFKISQIELILVLTDFGVQFVIALALPVLLTLLVLNCLSMLRQFSTDRKSTRLN